MKTHGWDIHYPYKREVEGVFFFFMRETGKKKYCWNYSCKELLTQKIRNSGNIHD